MLYPAQWRLPPGLQREKTAMKTVYTVAMSVFAGVAHRPAARAGLVF